MSFAPIPRERLHPLDIHRQLDWLVQAWTDECEDTMTRRLNRLEQCLRELPEPLRGRALTLLEDLCHARLSRSVPWRSRIVELRILVSEWRPS